ncbi:hypothetical protein AAEK50_005092 [Serratia marcescens]|jgi:DNA-binding CsgD family transcriptional regulator
MDCWPESNVFFKNGVTYLKSELLHYKCNRYKSVLFVDFHVSMLKIMLPSEFLKLSRLYEIVIITCPELRPLALFYFKYFNNVVAVFDLGKSVSDILCELIVIRSGERSVCPVISGSYLTKREAYLLESFLNGKSVYRLARELSVSCKTIYNQRSFMSKKMMVKNLEHLIMPFNLIRT